MMRLSDVAAAIQGQSIGHDAGFLRVSIDSRTLAEGDLFIAIRGDRFDGHDFVEQAGALGAAGAVVDEEFHTSASIPLLKVRDTRAALRALASSWRSRMTATIAAVAGSNGKTTTKEMIAGIFRQHAGDAAVLSTAGNQNNEIGVPLTLLNLRPGHRYAVVELGMNHGGEVARLAEVIRPEIAVVTNAQREHLEFIGSSSEAAVENSCLYEKTSNSAIAVVNFDDPHKDVFKRSIGKRRCISFGLSKGAAVTAKIEASESESLIRVYLPGEQFKVRLHIQGMHNVRNALAAVGVAYAAGVPADAIRRGLEAFHPYRGRLDQKALPGGVRLIDDTYNANPDSVRAAIDVLASSHGRKILILGDMGEVGTHRDSVHREVGDYARECGIDTLLAIGEATTETVASFGKGATHFDSVEGLLAAAIPTFGPGTTVLVKGSRFMRMERIVQEVLLVASGPVEESHAA